MPYCPKCRSEYRQGFDWCPDCKTSLVEALASETAPDHPGESASGQEGVALVTVATFANPTMASILASRLEAEGIETFIDDAETLSMDPLLATALGGVKVSVRVSDAEMGREIAGRPPERPPEDPEEQAVPCPNCKSASTLRESFSSRMAFLTILLLGFPWPFRKKGRRRCVACGHAWKENSPDASISEPQA